MQAEDRFHTRYFVSQLSFISFGVCRGVCVRERTSYFHVFVYFVCVCLCVSTIRLSCAGQLLQRWQRELCLSLKSKWFPTAQPARQNQRHPTLGSKPGSIGQRDKQWEKEGGRERKRKMETRGWEATEVCFCLWCNVMKPAGSQSDMTTSQPGNNLQVSKHTLTHTPTINNGCLF